jgi:hypothetical protein
MGYLCPVCAEPFGGGEPLANHLAVTAILHADDHEAWLDETVDDWASISRSDLADRVVDHAEAADDHDHPGDHSHVDVAAERSDLPDGIDADGSPDTPAGRSSEPGPFSLADTGQLDAEAQAIVENAKAYTRAMAGEETNSSAAADPEAASDGDPRAAGDVDPELTDDTDSEGKHS